MVTLYTLAKCFQDTLVRDKFKVQNICIKTGYLWGKELKNLENGVLKVNDEKDT